MKVRLISSTSGVKINSLPFVFTTFMLTSYLPSPLQPARAANAARVQNIAKNTQNIVFTLFIIVLLIYSI